MIDPTALDRFQMHGQDIPAMLAHRAQHRADHPALVWDDGSDTGRTWTWSQLWHDVRRVAAGLDARGVGVGDRVLLHSDNCPQLVLTWLACATVGAVGVTTNTKSVADEITYFASKARCTTAVTQPRYAALVAEAAPDLDWLAVIPAAKDDADTSAPQPARDVVDFDTLYGDADAWTPRPADPMLPFGVMFTSGTTSRPKAVVHTHANAVWAARSGPRSIDLGPDDTYLIYLPFFHVNAQSWSFFSVLGVGATAVLMPKWSRSRFWDVVVRREVTHISLMPFTIPVLSAGERPNSRLRAGVFGLIMPQGRAMFGLDVYAAYGMTETVTHAVTGKPSENLPLRSMGHPTPGYEMAVVDPDTGQLCDQGQLGELWLRGVRGIQLFAGYLDDDGANAAAFDGDWFKTGDMVRVADDGNVFYVERHKDLLKVGGENVSAREVEDAVGAVPGVAQVAVVGRKDDFLQQVPVAFVCKAPNAPDDAELERTVIDHCASRLAAFKVPRAVYVLDQLPTGTLDKILKNRLREIADAKPPV